VGVAVRDEVALRVADLEVDGLGDGSTLTQRSVYATAVVRVFHSATYTGLVDPTPVTLAGS